MNRKMTLFARAENCERSGASESSGRAAGRVPPVFSALMAAPDATRPDPQLPARFYTNPAVWNDGSARPPADRVAHVDDVGFLRTLLDELPRRWPIDPTRIYATGFSNGAGMTFRLGLELAGR